MSTIPRFRVKDDSKQWTDEGPDLLRQRPNAHKQLAVIIGVHGENNLMYRKHTATGWTKWSDPMSKFKLMNAFDEWGGNDGVIFQVGAQKNKDITIIAEVKSCEVPHITLPDVHEGCNIIWSLIKYQFPQTEFAGGFVCEEISPGYTSDHSWKDAIDATPPTGTNDILFSWNVRMCQSGCMDAQQILGSRNGSVVNAESPDWQVGMGGADSSHLWHNHIGYVNHHGANSPYCSNA